uniref:E3 binding domain-containing protein n=1 Tax=Thalassovita aquimarina TaxID=2785917 RepID=UPI00356985DB
MSDVIAPPSVRALAREKGIDLAKLARDLGRCTIAREDLEGGTSVTGPAGDTSYWDVDHSQYGPVSEEPMSRFAQVAAANLAAANALIPQVTHHDRADVTAIEALRK